MKGIRIVMLAFALCAVSASVASAQAQGDAQQGGRRGGMGGMLLKDITLTDAQKAQAKTIREKYLPQMVEIRRSVQATGAAPDDATRAKMTDLQNKQTAELRAILTADQQVVFDRNLADMKAAMEARRNGSS